MVLQCGQSALHIMPKGETDYEKCYGSGGTDVL